MKVRNIIASIIFVFLSSDKCIAAHDMEYEYRTDGIKIKIIITQADDCMQIAYKLYNTSSDMIYLPFNPLIKDNFPTFIALEFGVIRYSFDASHTEAVLRKINAGDSIRFVESIPNITFNKKIIFSFDCLSLYKLSKKMKTKVKKDIIPAANDANVFRMNFLTYSNYSTNWFRCVFPSSAIDRDSE